MASTSDPSPSERQVVEAYGDGRFRISGSVYTGSVIVLPDETIVWPVSRFDEVDVASLEPVMSVADDVDILLLGCGSRGELAPEPLSNAFRDAAISVEAMTTGAACRTYNVLAVEGRRVAAALIAVD
ncbi:MAG: Mth938-like domain-containing protein [Alphaproteobacteria bacterium]